MRARASDSLFGTFKKSSISEDIVENLLTLIRERELHPGDKLPPERELAATMQVSRPSLREALRALAIMNVIEIRQGDGTYVTSLEPNLLMSHLDFVFALNDSAFLELFEARRILEPGLVEMAAMRITDEEIAQLEECVARSIEVVDDHEAFAQADVEMHELIAKAAGNSILQRCMAGVSQLGKVSRRRTVTLPGVTRRSVQDHLAIIAALKARDPQAARQAMLDHLRHVEDELKHFMPFDGVEVDGVSAASANAASANADGMNRDGANADGVNSDGVNTGGASSDGGRLDGDGSDGKGNRA